MVWIGGRRRLVAGPGPTVSFYRPVTSWPNGLAELARGNKNRCTMTRDRVGQE